MSDVSNLLFVDTDAADDRWRVLLYGNPGAGKSVAAASAPGPIMVLSADRPGAYRYARTRHDRGHVLEVRVTGRQTLTNTFRHVRDETDPHPRTVVLDPLGGIYDTLLREIGGSKPQIQHHGEVQTTLLQAIKSFRDLDVNLVLVCHVDVLDSEEGGALRRPATGGQKLPDKVMAEMDIVAYCARVPGEGEEPDQYRGLLVGDRGRVTKDSSGSLGRSRALDLSEWFETASAAMRPDTSDLPWADDFDGPHGEPVAGEAVA